MSNYTKQKGNKGHQLTKQYLENLGWSVWIKDHRETVWRGSGYEWRRTGSNDIFAIPDPNNPHKKRGGFDIVAFKSFISIFNCDTDSYMLESYTKKREQDLKQNFPVQSSLDFVTSAVLYQVKKTKRNPITPGLKREIQECADYHKIPRSSCYIIWWPDGVGIKKGEPVIWHADQE